MLLPVRFDNLPTPYPYTLMISLAVTEAVLRERLGEVGGQVLWRRTVTDVTQIDGGVTAILDNGTRVAWSSRFRVQHRVADAYRGVAF